MNLNDYAGMIKIVRYNYPWYLLAALVYVVTIAGCARWGARFPILREYALLGLAVATAWTLSSLAISHYVYDRSALSRGSWLDAITAEQAQDVAIFHAGEDSATEAVVSRFPSARVNVFDFYDPSLHTAPSIARARRLATPYPGTIAISTEKIPLAADSVDVAAFVFAAHEIRRDCDREAFFRELSRILRPTGRAIIVEHVRDFANFLAYGPGFLHFLGRRTWESTFAASGLEIEDVRRATPFVLQFTLRRAKC